MATYLEIQRFVRDHFGFVPKTCWIAHVKELSGLPLRPAWNRHEGDRRVPCPPDKRAAIEGALRHVGFSV
jgi:hypothetical protein